MNLLWEAMVDEMRAERAEADQRRHFTEHNRPIRLVRAELDDWTVVRPEQDLEVVTARSATSLRAAADDDLFEVG